MFKKKIRDLSDLQLVNLLKITLALPTYVNTLLVFGCLTGQYGATKARQN